MRALTPQRLGWLAASRTTWKYRSLGNSVETILNSSLIISEVVSGLGGNKRYSGYRSFQYLEKGVDYRDFRLVREVGRVKSSVVPLSKAEEERVQEILEKSVVISLHDHPEVFPEDVNDVMEYIRSGRIALGYEGLAASYLDAVFDGLEDGTGIMRSPDPWDWDNIIYQIGLRLSDIAHQDFVIRAERVDDIIRAYNEGRVALVLSLEAPPTGTGYDIDRLEVLYGLGVRCVGITYSHGNELGSGLADRVDRGLTDLGYEVVKMMNKLGLAIDISHAGDKTSLDVIEASSDPVFITHAGARSLWPSPRLKPDEVIQALAEKGGVIGIEAAPHTTITYNNRRHSIESVMEHFQYIEKLVGIDYVAFGPDTLFGDHVALHKLFSRQLAISRSQVPRGSGLEYPEVEYVDGLENPAEFPNIVRWLVKHGYSDNEIRKVIGENVLRVLRRVWK